MSSNTAIDFEAQRKRSLWNRWRIQFKQIHNREACEQPLKADEIIITTTIYDLKDMLEFAIKGVQHSIYEDLERQKNEFT